MKMKEIGRGASQAPLPLDPPMPHKKEVFDYQYKKSGFKEAKRYSYCTHPIYGTIIN